MADAASSRQSIVHPAKVDSAAAGAGDDLTREAMRRGRGEDLEHVELVALGRLEEGSPVDDLDAARAAARRPARKDHRGARFVADIDERTALLDLDEDAGADFISFE